MPVVRPSGKSTPAASKPSPTPPEAASDRTTWETIRLPVTVGLVAVSLAVVLWQWRARASAKRSDTAVHAMMNVGAALQRYREDMDAYPPSLDGLTTRPADAVEWNGPYATEAELRDPWGNPIVYEKLGRDFRLSSPGPDGQRGTDDDIRG